MRNNVVSIDECVGIRGLSVGMALTVKTPESPACCSQNFND